MINRPWIIEFCAKTGFFFLLTTLFLISFPRSWSLYPLGASLTFGLGLWVIDFKNIFNEFKKRWIVILPPVFYFLIHFASLILQGFQFHLLENKLMFLLVPVIGFPIFISEYTKSRLSVLLTGYILGILIISIFLLIRIFSMLYFDFLDYPDKISFLTWINAYQFKYSSSGFSILEQPTYLALKLNWALTLLFFFGGYQRFSKKYSIPIIIILTVTLFFAASKAGLILWFVLVLIFIIKKIKTLPNPILYYLLIPVFIFLATISVLEIQRFDRFIITIQTDISKSQTDWKDFDQRTREWYSAIQIIKHNPIFGTGLSSVEDMMVKEFLKNGFIEEAALRLNAHNQFLEAQMTFGISGTLSLLFMLFSPFIFHKKFYFPELTYTLIGIVFFFLLIESMFNRQWGIMFFVLFYCILVTQKKEENKIYSQVVK
jgi:O-antigen ligase